MLKNSLRIGLGKFNKTEDDAVYAFSGASVDDAEKIC